MLQFDSSRYCVRTMEVDGQAVTFRAFENIVTVEHPVDPRYQAVSIYVPEAFYHGETVCGYDLHTAPILFENNIGGFFPSEPRNPEHEMFGHTSTFFYALLHGYVIATPGARGRTNQAADGRFYGKAPAALIDLKAALRYLWANEDAIPGDMHHMFSIGTSAGGCFAALTGTYDNQADCEPFLAELGTASGKEELFAVCCYCPVTDLEHADAAYEWQFQGIPDYHRMHMEMDEGGRPQFSAEDGVMTQRQIQLSDELAAAFPTYLNSLGLNAPDGSPLALDSDGSGSFRDFLSRKIADAAQQALDAGRTVDCPAFTVRDGRVTAVDFSAFMRFITRMKEAPPFDDVTMHSFENNLFGESNEEYAHFTAFSYQRSTCPQPTMASSAVLKLMNPLSYIREGSNLVPHWRFRQGTNDRDVGFATVAIIALALQNQGVDVDYALIWHENHGGDFDLPELFQWIDGLCSAESRGQ